MSETPLVSIVVVAYESGDQIAKTIMHLERVTEDLDVEILVVDNASTDDSVARAREALHRGRVIEAAENFGFGAGVNVGVREAKGRFVVMMNDDVLPDENAIQTLISVLEEDPKIGLVGPRMVHPDGSPSPAIRKHLPGLRDEIARISDLLRRSNTRSRYPTDDQPLDVGLLICAFVVARTELFKQVCGFNPAFFIYGEDIDLCARLHHNGYRTVTVPSVRAVHDQEVSPQRRIAGRNFIERILGARDVYYRIWLARPERILVNAWRALGVSDQPSRFKFHTRKAFWDGPNLGHMRTLKPL